MFINRTRELAPLERRYSSREVARFVLYGRRRAGKAERLHAFCRDKPHICFVTDLGTEASAVAEFSRQISRYVFGAANTITASQGGIVCRRLKLVQIAA